MAEKTPPQSRAPRAAKARDATPFERVSAWLTLAANLGVLVGIVLVLFQLNQNERMIRAQTRHEIAMGLAGMLSEPAVNPALGDLIFRARQGEPLTEADQYRLRMRLAEMLRVWEDVHYQYRMGLFDEEEFVRERRSWQPALTANRQFVELWCRTSGNYSAEFAAEISALLDPAACRTTQP